MTSALVSSAAAPGAPALVADLQAVGIHVLGAVSRGELVREAIRRAPDVVICYDAQPDEAWFQVTAQLGMTAPLPVLLFSNDSAAERIDLAARSGVHAYVVNGYGLQRLRPLIHLAQARFRLEQSLRSQLGDLSQRFEERKLIDRAKGVLMRARQLSEDEAFRVLRTASMHSQQRVGQVAQQVIDAAHSAQAINRSGQLRMLSQRIVKLCAWLSLGGTVSDASAALSDSFARIDANLGSLAHTLSKATFGDLLDSVLAAWSGLKAAAAAPPGAVTLTEVDALGERLLKQADQLTLTLEASGAASTLHVINVSGRQRMLSQRLAKQALLAQALSGAAVPAALEDAKATQEAFEQALDYLNNVPLVTRDTREALGQAVEAWARLREALQHSSSPAGRAAIVASSETLLTAFEHLTSEYERSMQVLVG